MPYATLKITDKEGVPNSGVSLDFQGVNLAQCVQRARLCCDWAKGRVWHLELYYPLVEISGVDMKIDPDNLILNVQGKRFRLEPIKETDDDSRS